MENKITTFPAAHNISAELMVFIMVFHWGYKLCPNTIIISAVTGNIFINSTVTSYVLLHM